MNGNFRAASRLEISKIKINKKDINKIKTSFRQFLDHNHEEYFNC